MARPRGREQARRKKAAGASTSWVSSLSLADDAAAHHPDLIAGDVSRVIGSEEEASVGNLFGPAQPSEGDLFELLRRAGRRLAELRVPVGVAPLGVHGARDDHVRANAEWAQLGREGAHEAEETGLGRRHRRSVGPPGQARLPPDGDDAAPTALLHAGDDRARQVEGRVQVDAKYAVPIFQGDRKSVV